MSPVQKEGLALYYCYASEDKLLRDELDKHLMTLKRQEQISTWHQGEIQPGTEWKHEISTHLQQSDIILLLISPDFFASEEVYREEMTQAFARHERHQALVIPVLLRPTDWEGTPVNKLQTLPINGKPITQWDNRDEAFLQITQGIRNAIKDLLVWVFYWGFYLLCSHRLLLWSLVQSLLFAILLVTLDYPFI